MGESLSIKLQQISLDAQRPRGHETLKQTLSKRQLPTESPLAEALIPVAEEIVMLQSNPCPCDEEVGAQIAERLLGFTCQDSGGEARNPTSIRK